MNYTHIFTSQSYTPNFKLEETDQFLENHKLLPKRIFFYLVIVGVQEMDGCAILSFYSAIFTELLQI